jgi:hypothetical protein
MTANFGSGGVMTAESFTSDQITALDTEVRLITSVNGKIKVNGHLQVSGSVVYNGASEKPTGIPDDPFKSFLEVDETKNVSPWQLVTHERFPSTDVLQWTHMNSEGFESSSENALTHCGDHNLFLGGHCSSHGSGESSRIFKSLPAHTMVRITARFHFIDSWDGESAYAKVNGEVVWLDAHSSSAPTTGGISLCGGSAADSKMGTLIDVAVPHTGDSLTLAFGSTLDQNSCEESWGVDDIEIFVR